ncbi:MAG: ketoacyl-ACP synthase III [Alphaproteobacteria bacterium]|nr:ketoacyl-ACP synthase III [Alphaproteobacteria bacterium]
MSLIRSQLVGTGYSLPAKVLTNDDLSKIVETNDEWISTRTGIRSRHVASEGEYTSDFCVKAAQMAMKNAQMSAEDIDFIILATVTPDNTFPSCAAKISKILGLRSGVAAMDINAACSGFVYATQIADNMIRLGQIKNALVIGAETLSRITDWTDRNTCVLFGDGAGAAIYKAAECEGKNTDTGILATKIYADGSQYDKLCSDSGVSFNQKSGYIHMDGKEVFKVAVPSLVQGVEETLAIANVSMSDVDWYIPHQANSRIIDSVAKKLEIDESKVIVTVDHHGNTSAASIPLALAESIEAGKVKKGDLVAFSSMGAGFTWGGMIIRI